MQNNLRYDCDRRHRVKSWPIKAQCHKERYAMDEVSTCTSCPKMPGKISVHKLWMYIRRLWMAIRSLRMAIQSLQTEISAC